MQPRLAADDDGGRSTSPSTHVGRILSPLKAAAAAAEEARRLLALGAPVGSAGGGGGSSSSFVQSPASTSLHGSQAPLGGWQDGHRGSPGSTTFPPPQPIASRGLGGSNSGAVAGTGYDRRYTFAADDPPSRRLGFDPPRSNWEASRTASPAPSPVVTGQQPSSPRGTIRLHSPSPVSPPVRAGGTDLGAPLGVDHAATAGTVVSHVQPPQAKPWAPIGATANGDIDLQRERRDFVPQSRAGLAPGHISVLDRADHSHSAVSLTARRTAQAAATAQKTAEFVEDLASRLDRLEHSERMRDSSTQRFEQTLSTCRNALADFERKLSETNGAVKAITEQTQSVFKSSDHLEARLRDFKQEVENRLWDRVSEVEKLAMGTNSESRQSRDGTLLRLDQLEELVRGHVQQLEITQQAVGDLSARVGASEAPRRQPSDSAANAESLRESETRLWRVEQDLGDLGQRMSRIEQEARGDGGWSARIEEHEVRLQGLRGKLDGQEEHFSVFSDRARQDWETRFKQVRQSFQEESSERVAHGERLEALVRWAEATDQIVDDIRKAQEHFLLGSADDGIMMEELQGASASGFGGRLASSLAAGSASLLPAAGSATPLPLSTIPGPSRGGSASLPFSSRISAPTGGGPAPLNTIPAPGGVPVSTALSQPPAPLGQGPATQEPSHTRKVHVGSSVSPPAQTSPVAAPAPAPITPPGSVSVPPAALPQEPVVLQQALAIIQGANEANRAGSRPVSQPGTPPQHSPRPLDGFQALQPASSPRRPDGHQTLSPENYGAGEMRRNITAHWGA